MTNPDTAQLAAEAAINWCKEMPLEARGKPPINADEYESLVKHIQSAIKKSYAKGVHDALQDYPEISKQP